jgi:hypothetical protein
MGSPTPHGVGSKQGLTKCYLLFIQHYKTYFWGGYTALLGSLFPRTEGGIQVLAGLAPPNQTEESFLRAH